MERLKQYWKEFLEDESGIELLQLAIAVVAIVAIIWCLDRVMKVRGITFF